jgi:hypothetical protein
MNLPGELYRAYTVSWERLQLALIMGMVSRDGMNWIVRKRHLIVRVRSPGTEPKDLWPGPESLSLLAHSYRSSNPAIDYKWKKRICLLELEAEYTDEVVMGSKLF